MLVAILAISKNPYLYTPLDCLLWFRSSFVVSVDVINVILLFYFFDNLSSMKFYHGFINSYLTVWVVHCLTYCWVMRLSTGLTLPNLS